MSPWTSGSCEPIWIIFILLSKKLQLNSSANRAPCLIYWLETESHMNYYIVASLICKGMYSKTLPSYDLHGCPKLQVILSCMDILCFSHAYVKKCNAFSILTKQFCDHNFCSWRYNSKRSIHFFFSLHSFPDRFVLTIELANLRIWFFCFAY